MTTSPSTGLSPEAKEFIPFIQIPPPQTIPLYINENPITSIYPSEQQLIYPLIKFPEIDFHIQPSQQFHIDSCTNNQTLSSINDTNTSQIVLLPNPGCYPGPQILYSSNNLSSQFYPEQQSGINYGHQQPKSNRISTFRPQRGTYRQQNSHYNQQKSTTVNNHRNFNSTNSKPISRGNHSYQYNEQKKENVNNDDKSRYQFRAEDFPDLPINQQQTDKIPSQLLDSNNSLKPSWNTIVSNPRPRSISPSSNKKTSTSIQSKSKPISLTEQQRSQSLTNTDESKNEKEQTKSQQKRSKRQKNKNKEEPKSLPTQQQQSVPFTLDDENAFPILGQEITITKTAEKDSSTKDNSSTPGLINKPKMKANQSYQIRLTDMFNALSTATQTKEQNTNNKSNKSSTTAINIANPLDSKPAPKRGKERENPKPRKPTKLKRIITKELEENQKQRQQLLVKATTIKQNDEKEPSNEPDECINEYTSASCSEESNNETDDDDDDDDDENLDHEPTSQLQTPYSHQMPQSNIKQQIHDSAFREYCSQLIDRQLDELCIQLLITLKRFQDRKKQQFQSNPERARRKRRFVHGIREVTKHLRLQRLKCVLIAPDCQSIQSQGGLNDAIEQIINLCKEQNIPYIFTLNRQKLGRCLNKISRISAIGIFDYSGSDDIYKQIIEITNENQHAYKEIINHDDTTITTPSHGLNSRDFYKILHRTFQQQQQQKHHIVNRIPNEKILPIVPAHYAHSRQTSDTSTIYIDPQFLNSIKKPHTRASSGTFDMGKTSTKKNHQRTLSDGAAAIDDSSVHMKHHSRTPSGCSAISQIEQQDYFEQSKHILMINNNEEIGLDNDENRLKSINEDTEESSRKNVEKWINDN